MRRASFVAFLIFAACHDPLPLDTRFDTPARLGTGYSGGWRPQLAVSDGGDALVMWQGMDSGDWSMWAARYTPAAAWGAGELVERASGLSQGPQLAIDGGGNAYAAWTQDVANNGELWTNRFVAANGWGMAGRFDDGGTDPQLVMNRAGAAALGWRSALPGGRVLVARFDPTNGWSAPETIDNPGGNPTYAPRLAIDDAGNIIAAWEDDAFSQDTPSSVWANRFGVGTGWGLPFQMVSSDDAAQLHDVAMSRAGDGVIIASAFTQLIGDRLFAASLDRGTGAFAVEELFERDAAVVSAALDDDGNTIVAWRSISGLAPDVWARRRPRGGAWEPVEQIGDAQSGDGLDSDSIVSLVIRPDGHARVVWAQENGGWINRYVPGAGWGNAAVLRSGITRTPELGCDGAGHTFAVWAEDDELWAAIEPAPQTP